MLFSEQARPYSLSSPDRVFSLALRSIVATSPDKPIQGIAAIASRGGTRPTDFRLGDCAAYECADDESIHFHSISSRINHECLY